MPLSGLGEAPPLPARPSAKRAPKPVQEIRLYELPQEFEALGELLEENGGELTPEIEARLDALRDRFAEKKDSLVALVHRLQRRAEAAAAVKKSLRAEMEYHAEREKIHTNGVERLKSYLKRTMEELGVARLDEGQFPVRIQANAPSVRWSGDPDLIPQALRKQLVPELDSVKALALWKQAAPEHARLSAEVEALRVEAAGQPSEPVLERLEAVERALQSLLPAGLEVVLGSHLRL